MKKIMMNALIQRSLRNWRSATQMTPRCHLRWGRRYFALWTRKIMRIMRMMRLMGRRRGIMMTMIEMITMMMWRRIMVQYSSEIGDNDYDGHDDHGGDVDHRHHDNYHDDIDDYNKGAPTSAKRRPQSGRVRRTGDFFFSIKCHICWFVSVNFWENTSIIYRRS